MRPITDAQFAGRFLDAGGATTNVKHPSFGAVGDGETDDSEAFRRAIQSAGRPVLVPAGTYRLSGWAPVDTTAPTAIHCAPGSRIVGPGESTDFLVAMHSVELFGGQWERWRYLITLDRRSPDEIDRLTITNLITDRSRGLLLEQGNGRDRRLRLLVITGNTIRRYLQCVRYRSGVERASIQANTLTEGRGRGFVIGSNNPSPVRTHIHITHNTISGLTAPAGAGEVQGILAFGDQVVISQNTLRDIMATEPAGAADVEGIYTKARFAVITGNSLLNAGHDQGAIAIKGHTPFEDGSQPSGYGGICSGNIIQFTPGFLGNRRGRGIYIQNDRWKVEGNRIDGHNDLGIWVSTKRMDLVEIRGNSVTSDHGTAYGVVFRLTRGGRHNKERVICVDNYIQVPEVDRALTGLEMPEVVRWPLPAPNARHVFARNIVEGL